MIKDEILLNKKNIPIVTQRLNIICDDCNKEFDLCLYSQIKGFKNYGKDLCRGCKQKVQIKTGKRSKEQYIKAGLGAKKTMKGKTLEEFYGEEMALKLKKNLSEKNKGEKNPNYNGKWNGKNPPGYSQRGKTYEEFYGEEMALKLKKNLSEKNKGEKNSMFGKPSPMGSGNGWSGWYKKWFFRSLKELSFMINVIERFNFKWENGELKKYKVCYIDYNGDKRNYFPDFILNNKYMVEIKPKKLQNTPINKIKKKYAIEFCEKNNLKYKLLSPIKNLSYDEIKLLVESGKLKFLDKYKKKFELWEKKEC